MRPLTYILTLVIICSSCICKTYKQTDKSVEIDSVKLKPEKTESIENAIKDTLSLANYLKLFDRPYTNEFNFGWLPQGATNEISLSYDINKKLGYLWIKLENGDIIEPGLPGWAYSYRKLNEHLFWLIYYSEGESGTSMYLCFLDVFKQSFSKSYQLANAFGDQGDWAYKYGRFENDSTYSYLLVYGDQEKTIDSISGIDRIKSNGDFIELQNLKLK